MKIKRSILVVSVGMALGLTGCSSVYYERPQARNLPQLPEVARPRSTVYPKKRVVVKRPKVITSRVSKYSSRSGKITSVINTNRNETATKVEIGEEESEQLDPYATIPDNSASEVSTTVTAPKAPVSIVRSSPAVKSLLIRAQADLAIGQTTSAVSKLERALRIESQNAKLWSLLAKAHYDQSDYQQSIAMAKKSIRYSNDDDLIAKNWALIKKSGLQSGDTVVVKEAINYMKLNP